LRAKIPDRIFLNADYASVYPYLLYAVEVYGNTCPTCIEKLCILNNKLLRILQHKLFRSHVPMLSIVWIQYITFYSSSWTAVINFGS